MHDSHVASPILLYTTTHTQASSLNYTTPTLPFHFTSDSSSPSSNIHSPILAILTFFLPRLFRKPSSSPNTEAYIPPPPNFTALSSVSFPHFPSPSAAIPLNRTLTTEPRDTVRKSENLSVTEGTIIRKREKSETKDHMQKRFGIKDLRHQFLLRGASQELANLTELIVLSLGSNSFSGSISFELGKLVKLEQL
ncbi:hypothetical protein K1719_046025 [Acacia pycnantha]|nr:hypothetical protein K1719_046025 [Acacia pycnantha]